MATMADDKPIRLHVNYKSGRSVTLIVVDWKVTRHRETDEVLTFEATFHPSNKIEMPYIGISNIESITKEV
jgi:hypothetical protein